MHMIMSTNVAVFSRPLACHYFLLPEPEQAPLLSPAPTETLTRLYIIR